MPTRSPKRASSRSCTTLTPSPYHWALPAEAGIENDPLRLRLDFHDESVILHDYNGGIVRTKLVSALDIAHALASELDLTTGLPELPRLDRIYHFASPASPPEYQKYPIATLLVNAEGTRRLLDRARNDGARFLFASTSEIYGDPLDHPQREDYRGHVSSIGPRSMYDESKRYAEALITAYTDQYDMENRIVRIFNTYGPHMAPHDGRVVSNFIVQALKEEP